MSIDVNALVRHCETVTVPSGLGRRNVELMDWQVQLIKEGFGQPADIAVSGPRGFR